MKFREGFVSNSSTSSFVCLGFLIDDNQTANIVERVWPGNRYVKDILELRNNPSRKRGCVHPETNNNFCPDCGAKMWVEIDIEGQIQARLRDLIWDMNGEDGICVQGDEVAPRGKKIIGVELSYDSYNGVEVDFVELQKKANELGSRLGTQERPRLFGGEYPC